MITEVMIYLKILMLLKKHNEMSMLANLLPSKDICQRQDKYVLTLRGQAYVFLLGILFFIFMTMALSNPRVKFPQGQLSPP